MPTAVPYPDYDDLFLLYNQLRRRLDSGLRAFGLTLTGLQVLVLVAQTKERRGEITRARIAETLGLTDSTLSTAIKGLTDKGFIRQKSPDDASYRNQPLHLESAGRRAMLHGLVVREDCLEDVDSSLSPAQRKAMFKSVRAINAATKAAIVAVRQDAYMKSLKKHATRKTARGS